MLKAFKTEIAPNKEQKEKNGFVESRGDLAVNMSLEKRKVV